MTKAILATFVDARSVKSRSVMQLVLEIPIEQADEALRALGGWPQPAESRWVGIALAPKEREKIESDPKPKERKPFSELRPSAQAALRCKEPEFWRYIEATLDYIVKDEEQCIATVREVCGVTSRKEFDVPGKGQTRWSIMESGYLGWLDNKTVMSYEEMKR